MDHRHTHQTLFLTGTLLSCLALTSASTANAAIYKWTDSDGIMHYSDERPRDAKLKITTVNISIAQGIQRSQADSETGRGTQTQKAEDASNQQANSLQQSKALSGDQQENNEAESKKQANIDEAKQHRCEQARIEFAILSKDIPVYLDDTEQYRLNWTGDTYTGRRNYLADEERFQSQYTVIGQKTNSRSCRVANKNDTLDSR